MSGRFGFHIVGTTWSGVARVAGSLGKHSRLIIDQTDVRVGHLSGKDGADKASDPAERTKARIDRFQAACWNEASRYDTVKWGCLSLSEQIGRLLDPPNASSPAMDKNQHPDRQFNAIDYFACRFVREPIIYVLRDGRSCIPAKVKAEKIPLPIAVARWRFSIYMLTRFALFAENLWIVRIEDLIENPDEEMRNICDFLGIELEDSVLQSIRSPEVRTVFAPLSPEAIEEASQQAWFNQISDDLTVGGYLE